jgi:hypothetical protein
VKKAQAQSLAGVIRERLASIEARLSVGVRQEVILAELAAEGYETTLKNLRNELCRARKKVRAVAPAAPVGGKAAVKAAMPAKPHSAPVTARTPEGKGVGAPKAEKPPENPLKKSTGFNYEGTKDIDPDDLV